MRSLLIATVFLLACPILLAQKIVEEEWQISVDEIDPNRYFGVTVANGMVGLVSSPDNFKIKDVVLNGAFDTYGRGRVANIMKVFNFADIEFSNPHFTEEKKKAYNNTFSEENTLKKTQSINFRNGTFTSLVDYKDLTVTYTLRSLRHLPFTSMVEVTIKAKKDMLLAPSSFMRAPQILRDVSNHYAVIDVPGREQIPLMTSSALSPTGKLKVAASSTILFESEEEHVELIHEEKDYDNHNLKFYKELKRNETFSFTVFGSVCTSAHFEDPQNEAERLTLYAYLEGRERNLKRHNAAWEALWEGDIVIKGDPQVQKDVRFALYHLYSFARAGTAYSMSPMGLSGLGYNGHVFWDTELWMYPVLLTFHPEIAKSLLEYRYERLQNAKRNAFAHGYEGAMFPWESDDSGQEATPIWALTGLFEHHITGDVGWAFWKYYQVTKDKEWLQSRGYPVLKEVADFWVSRAEEGEDGKLHINNVVGADEYAEGVDDNAFTNGVAKVALRYAADAAEVLGLTPDPAWRNTAERIVIPKFQDGTTSEYQGYQGQTIKQADVNLLSYPLDLVRDETQMKKDVTYYTPRYDDNGPAMGFAILALLYNWLGETDKSYDIFLKSYRPNQVPPFGVISEQANGTNPYFATGAGAMLQAVLAGYAGLEITENGVEQKKRPLPKQWKSIEVKGVGLDKKTFKSN
ncbi:MAG: glycoside hydrolase family 65 protein [Bacteroidota bacterium]